MGLSKQAKIMSQTMEKMVLRHLEDSRQPARDKVMFLLSHKAGLRAKEIAAITWAMVIDANGNIGKEIRLENIAAKGNSGRVIPLNAELMAALVALHMDRGDMAQPQNTIVHSERGLRMSAPTVTNWFHKLYKKLGLQGCSSHSGRRTFATRAAKAIVGAGGSLRDVQQLLGHSSLATTQRYLDGSENAKQRVVDMV
ncbi:MAG: site-specific integrase [Magnetococcales bacterium]|nr:site-specific integrase [Magnetococcales bacterium]